MVANVQIQAVPKMGQRVLRQPQHTFFLRHEAFQLQPFMIAPVLPGETLKKATFKLKAITAPIKNRMIGWWLEHYFFYVKMRDLTNRDDFLEMMLDTEFDVSSNYSAAKVGTYHESAGTPDQINWTDLCIRRISEEYFRDEGETWNSPIADGLPMVQIQQNSWLDSVTTLTAYAGEDVATDDTGATAGELERALQQWEFMRSVNMTDMSYDDFLRTFGVNVAKLEPHKPELLRFSRQWTYPSNVIDPSDGTAQSACSWTISDSIDKDRFFKEHGFIVGVTVCRPKIYRKNQTGSAVALLEGAMAWMPAIMRNEPYTSMKSMAAGLGPLSVSTDGYWVDLRDLFLYGDQFTNIDVSTVTDMNAMSIPAADGDRRYASAADVDALWVSTTGDGEKIEQDGVVSLNIMGTQVDQTPSIGHGGAGP